MDLLKVGTDMYINLDRVTYIEPKRKQRLVVHFAVGGGDNGGPSCQMILEEAEARVLLRHLEAHAAA